MPVERCSPANPCRGAYTIVGHAPKTDFDRQKFPEVRVSSLPVDFTQKCLWLFLLRLLPANALDGGTLIAMG